MEIQVQSDQQTKTDFRYYVRVKDSGGNLLATKKNCRRLEYIRRNFNRYKQTVKPNSKL
jgi:hypothetical protein